MECGKGSLAGLPQTPRESPWPAFNASRPRQCGTRRQWGLNFLPSKCFRLSSRRVRFLCSAEALPFELFENIQTNAEARQAAAAGSSGGGRAGANSSSLIVSVGEGVLLPAVLRLLPASCRLHATPACSHQASSLPSLSSAISCLKCHPGAVQQSTSITVKPNPLPCLPQVVDDNLGFAKDRTVSRLTEMQSEE